MKMFYMFVTMVFYVCCKMKITTILIVLMMLIITMVSMLYQALAAEATDCSVLLVTVIFLMLMEMVNVTFFVIVVMTVMVMRTPYEVPAPEATIAARHLCTWEQRRQCTSCSVGWCIKRL